MAHLDAHTTEDQEITGSTPILLFFPPLSGRHINITEILRGQSNLNSNNQSFNPCHVE